MSSSLYFSFNLSSKSFTFLSILDLQDLFGRPSTEEMVKLKAFRPKLLYKSADYFILDEKFSKIAKILIRPKIRWFKIG